MGNPKELKWGFISPKGEFEIVPAFDGASDFYEDRAAVKIDWARGYINRKGEIIIKPEFEAAGDFKDGKATVKLNGELRTIDREGNIIGSTVIPPVQNFETGFEPHFEIHDGLVRFIENQKYGFKDKDGKVVIKAQFFDATDFSEGLACVKKGKTSLWGYIDTAGKITIPALFQQARPFREGLAAVLTAVQ